MKVVSIFAERLYAFIYDGDTRDAYRTIQNQWNDIEFLSEFYDSNREDVPLGIGKFSFIDDIQDAAAEINQDLEDIAYDTQRNFDDIFKPFHNSEYKLLSLSLRKNARHFVRIYAIRIDKDLYVVTGGAIKLTRSVQERTYTMVEFNKLKKAKAFLASNDIFDEDSFREWESQQL